MKNTDGLKTGTALPNGLRCAQCSRSLRKIQVKRCCSFCLLNYPDFKQILSQMFMPCALEHSHYTLPVLTKDAPSLDAHLSKGREIALVSIARTKWAEKENSHGFHVEALFVLCTWKLSKFHRLLVRGKKRRVVKTWKGRVSQTKWALQSLFRDYNTMDCYDLAH